MYLACKECGNFLIRGIHICPVSTKIIIPRPFHGALPRSIVTRSNIYTKYTVVNDLLITMFVLLSFLFWPSCCLSSFDLRILITHLVSSSSSIMSHAAIVYPYHDIFSINTTGAASGAVSADPSGAPEFIPVL